MKPDLSVKIGRLHLKNPVLVASGTFGYAEEYDGLVPLKKLGAIVTKTITIKPRLGNPMPRIVETPAGLLNSIGLANEGIDNFIKEKLAFLKKAGVPIIVSIGGELSDEFVRLAKRLDDISGVSALELNISCPNIASGSRCLIAQDQKATYTLVKAVRRATKATVITKLSPNVSDITAVARAAEDGGSDAVSLVNTFLAMAIDVTTRRPKLGNVVGGLSGPAIKPLALRMVYETAQAICIPIIGMGGIMEAADALEFIIAGADAVAVGSANFVNPAASVEIIKGITRYMQKNRIKNIKELTGSLRRI